MAQGKFKNKTLPKGLQSKKQHNKKQKTQRKNHPIKPKKSSIDEARQVKKVVMKSVEQDIRAMAAGKDRVNLSKAQQAVAEYNNTGTTKTSADNS